MDLNKKIKCSSIKHGEIDAINYCLQCNVYICKKCSNKCRCLNCMNMDPQYINQNNNNNLISDVIYKNNINSEDSKNILLNKSSECESINDTFKIQRISVFINKYQTEINVEKISKEELNLLCKKRKHN